MRRGAIVDRRAAGRVIVTMALLLAFFSQALTPLQHLVVARLQAGGLQGDWVALCTTQGMKVVRVADLADRSADTGSDSSKELPDPAPQAPLCPICVGHVALGEPTQDCAGPAPSSHVAYSPLLPSASPAPARAYVAVAHGALAPPV